MFKVYSHYDMKSLTRQFTMDIAARVKGMEPITPEYLVVQTQSMKKYLALECARENEIFTQVKALMPKQFIMELGFLLTGIKEKRSVFERDVLPWALYRVMKEGIDKGVEDIKELGRYGGKENSEMRLFSLAGKTADIFDQYLLYRPNWLQYWEANDWIPSNNPVRDINEVWQKYLWRQLNPVTLSEEKVSSGRKKTQVKKVAAVENDEVLNPAVYMRLLLEKMDRPDEIRDRLPKRVFLFGMSVLPPEYLKIFSKLSELIDVTLYVQMPTQEYYGDLISDRQIQHRMRKTPDEVAANLTDASQDNALLRNLGRVGQDFMELLLDTKHEQCEPYFAPSVPETLPEDASLLQRLQWDVRKCNRSAEKPVSCSEKKWSIRIAGCYGALREVEVVHDLLLECFSADDALAPTDVLIVSPDLAMYGPLVQMVFGDAKQRCGVHIPFKLADQSLLTENKVARFAKDLLVAVSGRFEFSIILPLFEAASELSKQTLRADECDLLKRWCENSGIRWGYDDSFKTGIDLPASELFTWRFGVDRLMAGYVMNDDARLDDRPFFPAIEVGESSAQLFGRLAEFVDRLGDLASISREKHEIGKWNEFVAPLIAQILDADEELDDDGKSAASAFGRALSNIRERTEISGTKSLKFPFPIFMQSIIDELDDGNGGHGFFTGAVTVANIVPMRSIPFKVIVMLGMSNGKYPRHTDRPLFDLMSQYPSIKGDRDSLKTDRYTFLETILSAEERLIITWNGFSNTDGKKLSASVLVDELSAYLDREYTIDGVKNVSETVIVKYPLHPFSARYTSDGKGNTLLKTWNNRWFDTAVHRRKPTPLFEWEYPAAATQAQDTVISGNTIIQVLSDPMKAFLATCRIGRRRRDESKECLELFETKGLDEWGLCVAIQKELLYKETDAIGKFGAGGGLPPGTAGEQAIANIEPKIISQLALVKYADSDPVFKMFRIDTEIKGTRFRLEMDRVSVKEKKGTQEESTAVFVDPSKTSGKQLIKLWVTHLFLNLEACTKTTLVTIDQSICLPPIASGEALAYIRSLNELTEQCRHKYLPFIPDVSWAYVCPNDKGIAGGSAKGWGELNSILGNVEKTAYKLNPDIKKAFNDAENWDSAMAMIPGGEDVFVTLAETVYGPYITLKGEHQ